ncbi:hypothetical protein ACFOET_11625 [Parapedobacter deserti]|uniref:Uncharacterized protein n=1 Tax=Parapedobacter deserti TaxID=1912957 RepID=A0ABV7JME5_9SPHI
MVKATYISKRYGKGSTGFDTAVPPQASYGRSGGVPRSLNTPLLRKPAVLATRFPEPSQGTPGTAICAVICHPGPALPRQQRGDGGAEQVPAKGWKALVGRVKAKVTARQAQIHRYYLAHMRKHVALTTKLTFRFVRLIAITVRVSRWMWFRRPALSYGAMNRFVHDRRFALFRRRAVSYASGGQRVITIYRPPLQRVEAGARSTDTRLTNPYFKLKTVSISV